MPRLLLRLRFGGADGFLRGEPPPIGTAVQVLFQFPQRGLVRLLRSAGAVVELHRRRKVDLLHKRRAFGLRAKTQADTIVGKMVSFSISAMNNCRMCTQKSSLVKQAWVANAKYVSVPFC